MILDSWATSPIAAKKGPRGVICKLVAFPPLRIHVRR
jgi:hypothetical protein